MQIAGIEKASENPTTDGQTTSEDSQSSIPEAIKQIAKVIPQTPDNFADKWVDLTKSEQEEVRQSMEWMGVSVRRARKILRAYGGGKYLRRGIGAALALNFEFTSLEEAERALRWARKQYKNKDLPIRERVEAAKLVSSLTESIRRICESSLSMAEKFDVQENESPKPPTQAVNIAISTNNFPPVAQIPPRANDGVVMRDTGDRTADRDL